MTTLQLINVSLEHCPWACKQIFMCCTCSQHFIPLPNLFQQHFNFSSIFIFCGELQIILGSWTLFWLFWIDIALYAPFVYQWSFWHKIQFKKLKKKRLCKWFFTIFKILFTYSTMFQSMLYCACFQNHSFFNHGKPFGGVCLIVIGHFIF